MILYLGAGNLRYLNLYTTLYILYQSNPGKVTECILALQAYQWNRE